MRDGWQRIYRLQPRPLREVVTWIHLSEAFWNARLDALGDYMDRKHCKRR
ncbi:MAG: hypothetical protein H6Q90_5479 [Deltaproteobacteria bacterium]|nr:hypothetical protein [Deltaproteobacteria bacterium]